MTKTLNDYEKSIDDVVSEIEEKTGYIFDETEIHEVFAYTVRKCEVNGKGPDYIPILFENELRDYLVRAYVNIRSEQNKKARLAARSVMV